MSAKKDQHVGRSADGNWAVRSTGAAKASKVFPSKELAVSHARTLAKNASAGVYIHGKDGRVLSKDSYAKEVGGHSIKGKK